MPAKFAPSARAVFVEAVRQARAGEISQLREDHLFAALLGNPESRPLLGRIGQPDEAEAVWAEVREARRRGGITAREQEALAEFGIDLDEVVAHVEAQLGKGALDSNRAPARRGWRMSMSAAAKDVLKAAERQQNARGDRGVTAQHLLLGLLSTPGPFADALGARGITTATVLQAMDGGGPQAAA
jgi:hypothetical protein